jgi:hypothetical protein
MGTKRTFKVEKKLMKRFRKNESGTFAINNNIGFKEYGGLILSDDILNEFKQASISHLHISDYGTHWMDTLEELFPHKPELSDVVQGNAGDCYLLAVLQAILLNPKGGQFINNMMIEHMGHIIVRFFLPSMGNNSPNAIFVRVRKSLLYDNGQPVNSSRGAPLWLRMIEKALAIVLRCQSNQNISGGYPASMIELLTGMDAHTYNIDTSCSTENFLDSLLVEFLQGRKGVGLNERSILNSAWTRYSHVLLNEFNEKNLEKKTLFAFLIRKVLNFSNWIKSENYPEYIKVLANEFTEHLLGKTSVTNCFTEDRELKKTQISFANFIKFEHTETQISFYNDIKKWIDEGKLICASSTQRNMNGIISKHAYTIYGYADNTSMHCPDSESLELRQKYKKDNKYLMLANPHGSQGMRSLISSSRHKIINPIQRRINRSFPLEIRDFSRTFNTIYVSDISFYEIFKKISQTEYSYLSGNSILINNGIVVDGERMLNDIFLQYRYDLINRKLTNPKGHYNLRK